jgi:hypothetical protein
MSYLKQVALVNVEGLFSPAPAASYAKKVEIVQFLNPDGTVWTPVPDPVEPLKVVTKTTTTGEAVVGKKLTGTIATYEGGAEPVQELYQWQRSDTGDGGWSGITNWTDIAPSSGTTNSYTTVAADKNKYVRFASKAIDADDVTAYGSGNNVGPITAPPLIISDPTIMTDGLYSNPLEVYQFQTISMHSAVFAGGYGTITTKYRLQEQPGGVGDWVALTGWQEGIPTYDVSQSIPGDKLRFQTQGKDSLGTQKTSNSSVATVGVTHTLGDVSITPAATTVTPAGTVTLTGEYTGTAPNVLHLWDIRSGPGQITSPTNFASTCDVEATGQPGATIQVQCTFSDPSSSDSPKGYIATIIIEDS